MEQKHQADDGDDHRLLEQRVLQRVDRAEDQLRAIVSGDEAHAVGQPQRRDFPLDRLNNLQGVGANPHHDDTADRLAGAVPVGGAAANLRAVLNGRDVTEADGRASGAERHDALLEIAQVLDVAASAQNELAPGNLEHARADFGVGIADRARDVGERQAVADEPIGVDDNLVLPLEATERGDLGHAGHGLQRRPHREVLQRAQLGEVHLSAAVFQHVLIDPAQPAGIGPERRRDAGRQQLLHAPELLGHARPRPVDVGAIVEDGVGETHAEHRVATYRADAGGAL